MKTNFGLLATWVAGGLTVAFNAPTAHAGADDEVQKQAARLISQAISSRVGENIAQQAFQGDQTSKGGSQWGSVGYTPMEFDSLNGSFDVVQGIYGVDFGSTESMMLGFVVSLNTSTGTFSQDMGPGLGTLDAEFTSTSSSFGPYIALIVSDNLFFSGQATLGLSAFDTEMTSTLFTSSASGMNSSVNAEIAANYQLKLGDTTLRAKGGVSSSTSIPEQGDTVTSNSLVFSGEAESLISQGFGVYAMASSYYSLEEAPTGVDVPTPLYGGVGAFFRPNEKMQFGVGYQTQTGDDSFKTDTFMFTGRIRT